MNRSRPRTTLIASLLAASLALVACGGDGGDTAATDTSPAAEQDGELVISDARSRMSPRMAGVGAVYLTIENTTGEDDRLLSASVDASIAGRVEVHETFRNGNGHGNGMGDDAMDHGDMDETMDHGDMDDDAMDHGGMDDDAMDHGGMDDDASHGGMGMMGMREIEALDIPAGATVELVPGGYHIMLLELTEDLVPGQEFELTLVFEHGGSRTVTVEVREDV